ncbi:hypothetical protein ACFWBX_27325 [Streptomyces sp. NPDC059991]|uniref:hypothetical protein n=1 Tax=Streptomyces sp. NPDC059991 TaxID=3347028 RepID=UPI0036D0C15F
MTGMADRRHRGLDAFKQAGGLLLALSLAGLATACTREPAARELRAQATSPQAASRRTAEEQGMRTVIARLMAVEGLEHVLTRFRDSCARPTKHSVFENNPPRNALECRMDADVYFGAQADITDVVTRIGAARIAPWEPQADQAIAYALDYQRAHGRHPDGTLMSAPRLEAPGVRIEWDQPVPLSQRVEEPLPCFVVKDAIYERCSITPHTPMSVATARSRYGRVLALHLTSSAYPGYYFAVPRKK